MSTVTVVATVEAANLPPRVRLDVTDTGSSPALSATTVTRLDPDGRTVPVRTADGNPLTLTTAGSNRVGLLYDYEIPYGQPVSYSTLESPSVRTPEVTVPEERVWLVHPGVPELSMPVSVASFGNLTRPVARAVFRVLGRKSPVVQTDGTRRNPEGALELNTFTLSEAADFETLTSDASVLLLNVPPSLGWGVPTSYISVGDIEEGRLVEYAAEPRRLQVLPFQVVDRPVGGSQSERTWVDVIADNADWSTVMARYETWLDLLSGP